MLINKDCLEDEMSADYLKVYSDIELSGETIPFLGKGNVWIRDMHNAATIRLTRHIIYKAIKNTYQSQLRILAYDKELSGVFAPFSAMTTGENRVIRLIKDDADLNVVLEELRYQIISVQNIMKGEADSLYDYRQMINDPVEGYTLVVLYTNLGLLKRETIQELILLADKGPSCGISFLIVSMTDIKFVGTKNKTYDVSFFDNMTLIRGDEKEVSILDYKPTGEVISEPRLKISYEATEASEISKYGKILTSPEIEKNIELPTVSFEMIHEKEILGSDNMWQGNSTDGLTFAIGTYGQEVMEITIGDEINQRHNAIITGAVGQGKSNLIAVIIHSLCTRYSPKELWLYLLDFKEGVTFKAFSNIGQETYLPHAKALGLESDVNFGIAVLESLNAEYKRRMKLLKDHNEKSIRDLRHHNPEIVIPRIVVVIDEFQMMLPDDDARSNDVAELLESSVRLYRAAGIHFILASQTISGNMALAQKRDSIFGQVPIRLALKNSVTESQQTLGMMNTAAANLRPREVIVNLEYGDITQNQRTRVAFADESKLISIRQRWWEMARSYSKPPYVFESERRVTIENAADSLIEHLNDPDPMVILGDMISIDGEKMEIAVADEPGHNIAIIGSPDKECDNANGMLQSIAISLAANKNSQAARYVFFDFSREYDRYDMHFPEFSKAMSALGVRCEYLSGDAFTEEIKKLNESSTPESATYVFGSSMDRWEMGVDDITQESVLKALVDNGSAKGIHFFGWWIKSKNFKNHVTDYSGDVSGFNTKIFLRIDERDVQEFTSPYVRWSAKENRSLLGNEIEFSDPKTFIPYAPIGDGESLIKKIRG